MGFSQGMVVGIVLAVLFTFFILIIAIARRYKKVGPNEVLIISGMNHTIVDVDGQKKKIGYRIKKGGGAFVWPLLEKADILSLEVMTLDINTPEVYTELGVPIMVDGVAQIKIKGDDHSIRTAAEQFLSKGRNEIMNVAIQTVEGHLRAILGTMTVEAIYKKRDEFSQRVQEVAATDLANMGLQIVSFTLRDIRDKQGYLEALGKPRIAEVKRDALIKQAEMDRDAVIKSAEAKKSGEVARLQNETLIAEADKNKQVSIASYKIEQETKRAQQDLAYDLQKFKKAQEVKAEEVQVEIVEKQKRIQLQEQEISRREKELKATVEKPAEAERFRVQQLADAQRYRTEAEAQGRAAGAKAEGFALADANKASGLAEAEVIRAKGLSEAEAMKQKAASWQQYNQAAILQMFLEVLPQMASAVSAPLAKTEKITIVNMGEDGGGASKVTGDVTKIMAQLPPIIESLTGIEIAELIKRIPALQSSATGKTETEK
jgi:flotillin